VSLTTSYVTIVRVPGNSAAVTLLQDEVNNKGADNVNFEDEVSGRG